MKKKMKISKTLFIEITVLVLFLFLLISIPSFFNDDVKIKSKEKVLYEKEKSADIIEKTKLETINKQIMYSFVNRRISDSNSDVILNLVKENKINNRDNYIVSELLTMVLKNSSKEAKSIAKFIIEENLMQYDDKKVWSWRNYELKIKYDNKSVILYERKPLLLDFKDAKIKTEISSNFTIYGFEKYNFTLRNQENEILYVNLFDDRQKKELFNYIDIKSGKLKENIVDVNIEFVEIPKNYTLSFSIWI